ncbi:MFS transporter [Rhodobacteraceae bacterium]|nr:MFS transporter [Paracoccaceae bacterium]
MSQTETFEAPPNRSIAFAILLTASFMNVMDVTIVNVALPTLKSDFDASSNKIEWVVATYVFVFAVLLLPCGRLGDLLGRRRIFIWGVTVFTVASGLCGMAWSIDALIGARVLQGVGAAMMAPQAMALIPTLFAPSERGGAFSFFALAAGLASVSGPIIGGLLIEGNLFGLDWQPIFLVNVPVGIITVILAFRFVPDVPGNRNIGIDGVGIFLAGSALFSVLLPLVEAPGIGWKVWMWPFVIAAPLLAIGFVYWQKRQAARGGAQLIPVTLLGKKSFLVAVLLTGLLFSGVPGFFLVMAIYLQDGFGLSPLWSGLTVTPFSVGILLTSPISNWLGNRHLRARVVAGALTLAAAHSTLHFVAIAQTVMYSWAAFAPILFFSGFGLGITAGPLFQIALSGANDADSGSASGAARAIQQVGAAFGIAIMGGLFFWVLGDATPGTHDAYTAALVASLYYTISAFLILAASAFFLRIKLDAGPSQAAEAPIID